MATRSPWVILTIALLGIGIVTILDR